LHYSLLTSSWIKDLLKVDGFETKKVEKYREEILGMLGK